MERGVEEVDGSEESRIARPFSVLLFKIYLVSCGALALLLFGMAGLNLMPDGAMGEHLEDLGYGLGLMLFGLGAFVLSMFVAMLRPNQKSYTIHTVVIALGMTSCCAAPICLFLLYRYRTNPSVEAWYMQGEATAQG